MLLTTKQATYLRQHWGNGTLTGFIVRKVYNILINKKGSIAKRIGSIDCSFDEFFAACMCVRQCKGYQVKQTKVRKNKYDETKRIKDKLRKELIMVNKKRKRQAAESFERTTDPWTPNILRFVKRMINKNNITDIKILFDIVTHKKTHPDWDSRFKPFTNIYRVFQRRVQKMVDRQH